MREVTLHHLTSRDEFPSFEQAVREVEQLIRNDRFDPLIHPLAAPRLYHHGKSVADAVVLYHGFTNCPQQFDELAQRFFEHGANVYVPRIPLHGFRDRLCTALRYLSVARLSAATNESYRLTRALGLRVSAVGLSLGGSMALTLMQTQPIDHVVAVAPFLVPIGLPHAAGMAVMKVVANLPDRYQWWDPRAKDRSSPPYAYPGFPTHALSECVYFGDRVVRAQRAGVAPQGRRCTLIVNRSESAVNNSVNEKLVGTWQRAGTVCDQIVLTNIGKPVHDIIDPTTFPQGRTLVYPQLERSVFGV